MPKAAEKRQHGLFVYGADWRSEPTLKLCSEGTRLLWWEMLLYMAESDRRGFLLVNGRAPTPCEIAALTGTNPELVAGRLEELERNGVFSRDRHGVIYNRRLVRDEKRAKIARKNGKTGGNPTLRKGLGNGAWDNPEDKATDKPRARASPSSKLLAKTPHTENTPSPAAAPYPGNATPAAAAVEPGLIDKVIERDRCEFLEAVAALEELLADARGDLDLVSCQVRHALRRARDWRAYARAAIRDELGKADARRKSGDLADYLTPEDIARKQGLIH